MVSLKKSFTLIELTVVISVVAILSTIMIFGMRSAGKSEGQRADFLKFYEEIKSLKMRANLGKQNAGATSSVQKLEFNIGGSSYQLNSVPVLLKNKSVFNSIVFGGVTYTAGTVTINFYPTNYSETAPLFFGSCAAGCVPENVNFDHPVKIYLGDSASAPYQITFGNSGFLINTIDFGYVANVLPPGPTATPTQTNYYTCNKNRYSPPPPPQTSCIFCPKSAYASTGLCMTDCVWDIGSLRYTTLTGCQSVCHSDTNCTGCTEQAVCVSH